jgi:hypothetical protein
MVLRAGGKHGYAPEHVERLCRQLDEFLPGVEQVILSDTPCVRPHIPLEHDWPTWWSKMELFRPDIAGDLFYLDIDTTLVRNISRMAGVGVLAGISHRGNPCNKLCSGIMYLPERYRRRIWQEWCQLGPEQAIASFRGDQDFLYTLWPHRWQRFENLVPGCAVSFKYHVAPAGKVPEDAMVVYYHGYPKSWDAGGELP